MDPALAVQDKTQQLVLQLVLIGTSTQQVLPVSHVLLNMVQTVFLVVRSTVQLVHSLQILF